MCGTGCQIESSHALLDGRKPDSWFPLPALPQSPLIWISNLTAWSSKLSPVFFAHSFFHRGPRYLRPSIKCDSDSIHVSQPVADATAISVDWNMNLFCDSPWITTDKQIILFDRTPLFDHINWPWQNADSRLNIQNRLRSFRSFQISTKSMTS